MAAPADARLTSPTRLTPAGRQCNIGRTVTPQGAHASGEARMRGYYILAFDGDGFENVIYPAMRRAYYMNDFGPLERAAQEYPQLTAYLEFSRDCFAFR